MIPHRVRLAVLLAFVLNGVFILTARYRLSYDAYTHMLFADHYLHSWWSLWDPRWYTGFSVVSYPPLVHQLIGLLGKGIGVDAGYAIISWIVLAAYPLAAYAFARVFVDQTPAEYAALGAAFLPSIYLTAYTFGQLPTLFGTLLALFWAAALAEFLQTGQRLSAALAVMLVAVILGAHHATLLFMPWLMIAVVLHLLLNRRVNWKTMLIRLALWGPVASAVGLLVIWPFWRWGIGQTMQTPIAHATRHSYLTDPFSGFLFFFSIYGPLIALFPFALRRITDRRYFALSVTFLILLLLGLGGTTPIPRWIFGSGWEWLTYDRFSMWATLLLLPFLGVDLTALVESLPEILPRSVVFTFTRWKTGWTVPFSRFQSFILCNRSSIPIFCSLAGFSVVVSLYPSLLPTQPQPVDMKPIVQYLAQENRSQWRYLTFGFGDQFAYLNRLTSATTIDGSYHTARTLPELRSSGIGQIDSVYWLSKDLKPLDPILKISGKYGVRWGFVDNPVYIPALMRNGWKETALLKNGIQVWENPSAIIPPPVTPPVDNPLEAFSWGSLPLFALVAAGMLAGMRIRPTVTVQALHWVHTAAVSLLPIGLVLWYFRSLTQIDYPRVYFTYDNAVFFLSDALVVIAFTAWAVARWYGPAEWRSEKSWKEFFSRKSWSNTLSPWLFALCCLASLSVIWSQDWRLSLYLSLHLWLGFGLFLSLRDRPSVWQAAAIGFCVALAVQVISGFAEYALQSTRLLAPIHLNWPGGLDPSMRGASVVQLVDGTRWLRVYGTLPHPNILGTFIVALLSGPAAFFLLKHKARIWALLLFCCGLALLVLSFSRGAWVGFAACVLVIAFKSRYFERMRLLWLGAAGAVSLLATVIPLHLLIFTRIAGAASVPTEAFSIKGRDWLAAQAVGVIQQHPLIGIGIGSFILNLAQHALPGYIIEPAHSLPLLVVSELGVGGAVILAGLVFVILKRTWQIKNTRAVLVSAALVGLCVTSLFDHSLWTLGPGRTFLALFLGLWAGQVENEIY